MESTRGNTHSVTFFPPGNVFFGSMISTMHPLTTNTAAVLREEHTQVENLCYERKTHRLTTCATGESSEGLPVPGSRAMEASVARMAKRSGHAVSVGQEARRERPAMGHWQPRALRTGRFSS
jgi:hypothetical protein